MGTNQHYISLGGGVKLMSEGWYLNAFGGQLTQNGFRRLCRALSVPMIFLGEHRFVDMHRFELAMNYVCGFGQKDFVMPGATPLRRGLEKKQVKDLDLDEFRRRMPEVIEELMQARKASGAQVSASVRRAAKRAADNMVEQHLRLVEDA